MKIFVGVDSENGELTKQEAITGATLLAQALSNEFKKEKAQEVREIEAAESFKRHCPKCNRLLNIANADTAKYPAEQIIEIKVWCQHCTRHTIVKCLSLRDFEVVK